MLAFEIGVMINRDSWGHLYFIVRCCEKKKKNTSILNTSPLRFDKKFEDDVVLILDDREQFVNYSSWSGRMIEDICSQFKIQLRLGV